MDFNLDKLLIDVFDPQLGEKVLIIQDLPHGNLKLNKEWVQRFKMAKEWHQGFSRLAKKRRLKIYPILSYKATEIDNAPLPKFGEIEKKKVKIEEILKEINICVALTEYSATAPLTNFAKKFGQLRIASMPRISKRMESTALTADYNEIAKKTSILASKLEKAVGAQVKFSTGHQFYFDLRNRKAGKDDGRCHPDKALEEIPLINLPSGEAFIAPYEGENARLGASKTRGYIPIQENNEIIVLKINKNKIVEVTGKGPMAERKRKFFFSDRGRRNIAEFGLGCNDKAVVTGNVLEDEKAGFHWAYGLSNHLGGVTGVNGFEDPQNAVHTDIVYAPKSPLKISSLILIYPDGVKEEIMKESKYQCLKD